MEITVEKKKEIFRYLRNLRESGRIKMMGAAKYIEAIFGLSRFKARDIFIEYMQNPSWGEE